MEYSILNKKLNDGRTDYEITYKNAYIHLIVGKDYYNTDKQSIEFDLIFERSSILHIIFFIYSFDNMI